MGDAQAPQSALEFAPGIALVVAGAGAEEAEGIGIDGRGQAPDLEGGAEVQEVVPGGVGGHETAGEVEAGVVVDGQQQDLLGGDGPPWVEATVVLSQFAAVRAAEAPVDAGLALRGGHEMGIVGLDVGLDRGAGPDHAAAPLKFVGDQLVVGRVLERQELLEKAPALR